jgi:ribosomal protein S17E
LVLESSDLNLIFYGEIDSNGKCKIPVKKLKSIIDENTKGTVKLEVIAEDTYFEPWTDTFEIQTNKKVVVEVKSSNAKSVNDNTKRVTVVEIKNDLSAISSQFLRVLARKRITVSNLKENKNTIKSLSSYFVDKYSLNIKDVNRIIENVMVKLPFK